MTFDDRPLNTRESPESSPPDNDAPNPGYKDTAAEPEVSTEATRPEKKQGSMVREIVETLLLALIIFVAVRAVVLNFRVDGLSMTPSLQNSEMLLVNRNAYAHFDAWSLVDWLPLVEHAEASEVYPFDPPRRGDIIVFNPPVSNESQPYIKRVIGLPGETVEIRAGGVYIDGNRLDEPYLNGAETPCASQPACGPFMVPQDSVFVLGDNRDNSTDSPDFGPVSLDRIIGKAWLSYWPLDRMGTMPHLDYGEPGKTP